MQDVSIAVFIVYVFTSTGSQTPTSSMLAIIPLCPSMPKNTPFFSACFYLKAVTIFITLTPQLSASVLGIISNA
jgi:hypothetical protein